MHRPVAAIAALLFAVTACIPSFGEDPIDKRGPTATVETQTGGTIRIATDLPSDIDPGNVHEPNGALIVSAFCDTLIAFDPATAEPRPAIAHTWTVTRGGRKLFLKLRRGVMFSDGSEVTADDVAFTFSRVASEEYASASADLLAPVSGFGIINGEVDSDNARLRQELAGVGAADRYTVEITLDEPRADFLRVLGHPALAPVSRAAVEADPTAFVRQPVCAGPYRVARPFDPDQPVVLARVDDYYARNAAFTAGGAGYADRIIFTPSARGADVARAPAGTRGSGIEQAPGGRVEFIGLPTSTEPFNDAAVREALSRALDRAALARAAGDRIPAIGVLPPGLGDACGETVPRSPDLAAARALLRAERIDLDGVEGMLLFNAGFGNAALAQAVASQWRDAFGLRLTLEPIDFDSLVERARTQSGLDAVFRFGWEASYPGPEPFLVPLFDDSGIGVNNFSRFDSAGFADTLEVARREIDDVARVDAYARVADVVCRELPMIPVAVDVRAFRVSDRVGSAIERYLDAAGADPIVRELFVRT